MDKDQGYDIKEIHYRDIYGKLIWKDEMIFRRLYGVGDEIVHNYIRYIVKRVAVADNIQHVNLENCTDRSMIK